MKGKLFQSIVAFAVVLSCGFAFAFDVQSGGKFAKEYKETVRVVKNGDDTVTFLYCEEYQANAQCRHLGKKERYKVRDIKRRQEVLKKDARRMAIADGSFIVASAVAGTIVTLAAANPVSATGVMIYAASGAAGGGIYIMRNYLLPHNDTSWTKYRQARTIQDRLLAGETVTVNEPITEFAQRLDEILNGIF